MSTKNDYKICMSVLRVFVFENEILRPLYIHNSELHMFCGEHKNWFTKDEYEHIPFIHYSVWDAAKMTMFNRTRIDRLAHGIDFGLLLFDAKELKASASRVRRVVRRVCTGTMGII